jgi:hypothetical protein
MCAIEPASSAAPAIDGHLRERKIIGEKLAVFTAKDEAAQDDGTGEAGFREAPDGMNR